MGTIFWLFGYLSGYVAILAMVLCIASGLYLLSELAEEFATTTARVLRWMLIGVTVLQIVLWIDGLSTFETVIQMIALGAYALMYRTFPFIDLFSPASIASILAFLITNVMWLRYFLKEMTKPLPIIGFFVVVVWAIPIGLFVSMTVGDSMLPGAMMPNASLRDNSHSDSFSTTAAESSGGKNKSIFRSVYDSLAEMVNGLLSRLGGSNPFHALGDKRR